MTIVRIPMVAQMQGRDAVQSAYTGVNDQKDQVYNNLMPYVIKNELIGKQEIAIGGMEGVQVGEHPSASNDGTAIKNWTGNSNRIVAAFTTGANQSTIYDSTTSLGTTTGYGTFITETSVSGTATVVIQTDASKAYYFQPAGSLTLIASSYPSSTTGKMVHKDGYSFVATPDGRIYNSNPNSITTWGSSSYVTAGDKPDSLLTLAILGRYILAFGTDSIEFFYNAGNAAGGVLSRVGKTINLGTLNQYSVVELTDKIAFVGVGGGIGVYMLDSDGVTRVSTPPIERMILANQGLIRLNAMTQWGRPCLQMKYTASSGSEKAFLYDPETKLWVHQSLGKSIVQTDVVKTATYAVGANADGYIYYSSNFASMSGHVRIGPFDFGNARKRKSCSSITVVGQSARASTIAINWTDNDGTNWTTQRTLTLDDASQTLVVPKLFRCGSFFRRTFGLQITPNASVSQHENIKITHLELELN